MAMTIAFIAHHVSTGAVDGAANFAEYDAHRESECGLFAQLYGLVPSNGDGAGWAAVVLKTDSVAFTVDKGIKPAFFGHYVP